LERDRMQALFDKEENVVRIICAPS